MKIMTEIATIAERIAEEAGKKLKEDTLKNGANFSYLSEDYKTLIIEKPNGTKEERKLG